MGLHRSNEWSLAWRQCSFANKFSIAGRVQDSKQRHGTLGTIYTRLPAFAAVLRGRVRVQICPLDVSIFDRYAIASKSCPSMTGAVLDFYLKTVVPDSRTTFSLGCAVSRECPDQISQANMLRRWNLEDDVLLYDRNTWLGNASAFLLHGSTLGMLAESLSSTTMSTSRM